MGKDQFITRRKNYLKNLIDENQNILIGTWS